jgi:hypothetical protein
MEAINTRLRKVLHTNNTGVAVALGLSAQAYSNRISRGAVPVDDIKALCKRNGLNAAWVLNGSGAIYIGGVAQRKQRELVQRLKECVELLELPDSDKASLNALFSSAVTGKTDSVKRAVHRLTPTPCDRTEKKLLASFRECGPAEQKLISAMARQLQRRAYARAA